MDVFIEDICNKSLTYLMWEAFLGIYCLFVSHEFLQLFSHQDIKQFPYLMPEVLGFGFIVVGLVFVFFLSNSPKCLPASGAKQMSESQPISFS